LAWRAVALDRRESEFGGDDQVTREDEPAGWTARGVVALGAGLVAACFAVAFLVVEGRGVEMTAGLWAFAGRTAFGHAAGGFVAGWALAGLFGRGGLPGWALSVLGMILVTVLGGVLGTLAETLPGLLRQGGLMAEIIKIGAGAAITPLAIASLPWLGAVWVGGLAAIHLAARAARTAAA
jgi:hypothetical protein